MWEHCLTQPREATRCKLDREVDWVIKYNLIEAYRDQARPAAQPPRVALIDLQYHDVNRDAWALLPHAETAAWSSACAPTTTSTPRSTTPPQTTRARLRGEFIRRAKERKRDYTVDWVHLKLNDQAQRTVLCKDPFKSRDERVEKLIAFALTASHPATLRIPVIESDLPPSADTPPSPEEPSRTRSSAKSILEWLGVILGALLVALRHQDVPAPGVLHPVARRWSRRSNRRPGARQQAQLQAPRHPPRRHRRVRAATRRARHRRHQGPDQARHRAPGRDDRRATDGHVFINGRAARRAVPRRRARATDEPASDSSCPRARSS